MAEAPSLGIQLFGTEQPIVPPRLLRAGDLTAELEAGNLRYIRFAGAEMIRAVSFIVRDRNWGTYDPAIRDLAVEERGEGFRVSYSAIAKDASQEFRYEAEIAGRADGTLSFVARGRSISDFVTNRTGFVVLHPIADLAGKPAWTTDVSGRKDETQFPALIDPVQPMMNLRAITHEFSPGANVTCRMEGDTFEMEDQRNWTDASYKTYVRPLALPWPYALGKGTEIRQAVVLTISDSPAGGRASGNAIHVRVGEPASKTPPLGLGLDPDNAQDALANAATLRSAGASHLVCHHDPRRGHNRESLAKQLEAAKTLGADPWLEAVIARVEGFEDEVAALGEAVQSLGSPFPVVMVSPAPDLKCTLPGSPWPPCAPARDLLRAARGAFPEARLGGGMFSYFTELNRKRPPLEDLDFVTFTTSALVHAGDDRSVTEGLESLPYIARSIRAFIGDRPYSVGPSAIGMRDNPYGATTRPNPGNIRQAMNRNDPRQRGLLGAAWNLAYFAHFAAGGAERIALGEAVGPFGLIHVRADFPQPWFDEAGGLFPVYHVVRGLARLRDRAMRRLDIGAPREIQGFAVDGEIWLANLMGEPRKVKLEGAPRSGTLSLLDAESFVAASRDREALDVQARDFIGDELELSAYAVARLRLP